MKFLLLITCALFTASSFVCAMEATESQVALAPQGNWAELRAQFDELLAQTTPNYFDVTRQCYGLPEPERSEAQEYVYSKIQEIMAQAEPLSKALSSRFISLIMFSCRTPLKARKLIMALNKSDDLHEEAWKFLLSGAWTSDAGSRIMFGYCNLQGAECDFIQDFQNIVMRSKEDCKKAKLDELTTRQVSANPFDHFVVWGIGLSNDNPSLRKALEEYYCRENEMFTSMQKFLVNDLKEFRCPYKNNNLEALFEQWRKRISCLDLNFLMSILAMETRAHAESNDRSSIFNMISILKKHKDALGMKRDDFKTGQFNKHREFFTQYIGFLESEIIRCTDPDASFTDSPIKHYIDAFFHNGDKFSISAQYKLLKKFEGKLPERLQKHTDKDLHNLKPTSLTALIFIEELFAFPEPKVETRQENAIALMEKHVIYPEITVETRQETQIALLGAPEPEQNALLKLGTLLHEQNSFKQVCAMFREMVLDGEEALVEAILKSGYGPLAHLVKSLYEGENKLTLEELELVSPSLDSILKEAPTKVSQNKKCKKNKTTPEQQATHNIFNFKAREPFYQKATLHTEYDHVGLEALKAKQSSVEKIKNMTPTLGLEYLEGNNKIKVRAYFVNGDLVDQKTYRNAHEQKQLHTIGTHLPHGGRTLDKTFQAELYGMIDQIFGLSQPKK